MTGANRFAKTDPREQTSPSFADNAITPTLAKGHSFDQFSRLIKVALTSGESEDLGFWDPSTGINCRGTFESKL